MNTDQFWNTCEESIKKIMGPTARVCDPNRCSEIRGSAAYRAICLCRTWDGKIIPDCEPKEPGFPIQTWECYNPVTGETRNVTMQECTSLGAPWQPEMCFCCCFQAAEQQIAGSEGEQAITTFETGDKVQVATANITPQGIHLSWSLQEVTFSDGITSNNMGLLRIFCGERSLSVTGDQLFLLSNGKLKRADALVADIDHIIQADGAVVQVDYIEHDISYDMVHYIAVHADPGESNGTPDNHLLSMNGVIVGDYFLQLQQNADTFHRYMEC